MFHKTNAGFRKKHVSELLFVHQVITKVEVSFFLDKRSRFFLQPWQTV